MTVKQLIDSLSDMQPNGVVYIALPNNKVFEIHEFDITANGGLNRVYFTPSEHVVTANDDSMYATN